MGIRSGAAIDFDDLMMEKNYAPMMQYSRSKLANILFTLELSKRLAPFNITANSLHPGVVGSDFMSKPGALYKVIAPLFKMFALSTEDGAKTSIYLSTSSEVDGVTGKYFDKCKPVKTSREAQDEAVAAKLWSVSEQLIDSKLT